MDTRQVMEGGLVMMRDQRDEDHYLGDAPRLVALLLLLGFFGTSGLFGIILWIVWRHFS
jgi:hypothetical protein